MDGDYVIISDVPEETRYIIQIKRIGRLIFTSHETLSKNKQKLKGENKKWGGGGRERENSMD